MIKVHCFVSCVCEVIKQMPGVDHRPYYFGVWDADFDVSDEMVLAYHSEQIDHEFFREWYELLYGIRLRQWYDRAKPKEENISQLLSLLADKPPHRHVMVMLDLSLLPERENKFHQTPFPHYVMLEETENEEEWFMHDPDFRWEGRLPKERILAAIREPVAKGGYYFDAESVIAPSADTVRAYFRTCMKLKQNPMTEAVRAIIHAHTSGVKVLKRLPDALRQLPVLAIRKYAYEHAFAYFWKHLGREEAEFEAWCDEIERLVRCYTAIQYKAMKLAVTERPGVGREIEELLEEQDGREFKIKQELQQCFHEWEKQNGGVLV